MNQIESNSKLRSRPVDPGFLTRTAMIQLLYGIWVNMAHVEIGLAFGLPAVQVPQLSKPESNIKITRAEASWITSILTLFSPIGCLISGYLMDKFGRRVMIIACQGPMIIGWLYTGLAESSKQIIIGRALTGIGCGMAMGPPRIFTTEISLPNMRGVIGSFPSISLSLGISMQAGLGSFFDWQILCFICSAVTIINLLLFFLLPETPYFVLKVSTAEKARESLAKFRGSKYDLDAEMTKLIEFKTQNDIRKLTFRESLKVLFSRRSCKPFSIIITFILIAQGSGVSVLMYWAVEILKVSNSSLNVYKGNFLLAVTRLVVGTITSVLLFRVGRKPLALISATGLSCVCLTLAFFLYFHDGPSLVPQIFYMLYMAFSSMGFYTLPFLMATELYPLQVRGTLNGITVSTASFFIFGSSMLYPSLRDNIGLAFTMGVYGLVASFGGIFLYFCLPETKKLTLQEIEEYYKRRQPELVPQKQ